MELEDREKLDRLSLQNQKPVHGPIRRLTSWLLFFSILILGAYTVTQYWILKDDEIYRGGLPSQSDSIQTDSKSPSGSDLIQLRDLPPKHLPQTGKHRNSGRLVVVGDVHGMKDSLVHLLAKIDFDKKHDHLIFAGDMISKGPDSKGVVDLAMKLGASAVRGNHEDAIIKMYDKMLAKGAVVSSDGVDDVDADLEDDAEDITIQGHRKQRKLVRSLGKKRIAWLKKCPVILRVGQVGSMGEVIVVHGGLNPGVKLEKQDPNLVMTMRTIDKHGNPTEERSGSAWTKAWNKYQERQKKKNRQTAIFGHDSKKGLQVDRYSIGLDTSCLRGGRLTAVVLEGGSSEPKHRLVHVSCKDGRG